MTHVRFISDACGVHTRMLHLGIGMFFGSMQMLFLSLGWVQTIVICIYISSIHRNYNSILKYRFMREARHHITDNLTALPNLRRAGERSRSWDGIACWFRPVELKLDAWISRFVCTREADCSRTGSTTSCYVYLGTFHVELSTRVITRSMESDKFGAEEISEKDCVSQNFMTTFGRRDLKRKVRLTVHSECKTEVQSLLDPCCCKAS